MSWLKLISKSILCGIIITIVVTFVCMLVGNKTVSQILLSPLVLLIYTLGHPPLLGYAPQGNQMYEGTPIDGIIIIFGIFLCIPFYSTISFFVFALLNRSRKTIPLK